MIQVGKSNPAYDSANEIYEEVNLCKYKCITFYLIQRICLSQIKENESTMSYYSLLDATKDYHERLEEVSIQYI